MPIIEVKALAHRFNDTQKNEQVISALTQVLVDAYGAYSESLSEAMIHKLKISH